MTGSEEARVVVTTGEALRTEVSAGGHTVVADEPESLGGTDAGPTPYDYLLAALGGCTAMTLRMYADRKGWPREAVTVRLSQDRIHAKDCGECETEEGRIDRIEREIEMVGPLDEKQRRRLLEARRGTGGVAGRLLRRDRRPSPARRLLGPVRIPLVTSPERQRNGNTPGRPPLSGVRASVRPHDDHTLP